MSGSEADRAATRARLHEAIARRRARGRAPTAIPPRPPHRPARLGEMARSLWVLHQVDPASSAYHLASAYRVPAALDPARLDGALNTLVARHRILRSRFVAAGDEVRQVIDPGPRHHVGVVTVAPGRLVAAAEHAARRPFDLRVGPLLRLELFVDEGRGAGLLLLVMHHLLADERALALLWQELAALYDGAAPAAPPAVQLDDYVPWAEEAEAAPARRAADLAYWRERLTPVPEPLVLPCERAPRPGAAPAGRFLRRPGDRAVRDAVRALAAAAGTTPFAVCAFAFRLLLERYLPGRRPAFGIPVSTRADAATADMIGYFLNPLVIATAVDESRGVVETLARFAEATRDAIAHASVPFDVVAGALARPGPADRHPIFQVMFVYQEPPPPPRFGGERAQPVPLDLGASKFDLTLFVADRPDRLDCAVEYRTDRFDGPVMERLLGHYATLLAHLADDRHARTADVPMLTGVERAWLRAAGAGPPAAGAWTAVPRRILDRCRTAASRPAVRAGGTVWRYDELRVAAAAVARRLVAAGVRPGDRVGLCLDRSVELPAAIVGIHWAGAAYVPVDPAYPAGRNRAVLDDAAVAAVVTTPALARRVGLTSWPIVGVEPAPERTGSAEPAPVVPPVTLESPAYLLYTSGSTGRPKGVVVTHGNLAASTAARAARYATPPERFLLVSSVAFDSSVAGIFWTLTTGGTLVVPTGTEVVDPARLTALVADHGVTTLLAVPTLYAHMLDVAGPRLRGLRTAIVAGERCPPPLVRAHRRVAPETALFNEYGPTEATVWATCHEVRSADAADTVPIGRPIPGVRVDVVDPLGRPVPAGVPGEAWIGGPTVAAGYWRQPELTRERFVVDDAGRRRYRSGDRVRWTDDGDLEFLGRDDEQVKLHGVRIEPGEIEAALVAHPDVDEAVVIGRPAGPPATGAADGDGPPVELVAFVRRAGTTRPTDRDLQAALASRLPAVMVPRRIVTLDTLPRLPNGKVDRSALRAHRLRPAAPAAAAGQPRTEVEQGLVALWEGLLGRPGVGAADNFFELGGHSWLVVQMTSAVERDYGVTLTAPEVFQHPTVRGIATLIAGRAPAGPPYQHLFPIQPGGSGAPVVMAIPHFFAAGLAARFRGERPVYGLRGVSLRAEGNAGRWRTMADLGTELADEMQRRFPETPFLVAGYSFGASMAFEAVRVLEARGVPVHRLYLIAPMPLDVYRLGPIGIRLEGLRAPVAALPAREALRLAWRTYHPGSARLYRQAWRRLVIPIGRRLLRLAGRVRRRAGWPPTARMLHADVRLERFRLHGRYQPGRIRTPTTLFNAATADTDAAATWRPCFAGPLTVCAIPDPHDEDAAFRETEARLLEAMGHAAARGAARSRSG